MRRKAKARTICSFAIAIACLALASACGEESSEIGSKPPDYEQALAGAPKPLAGIYAQANQLLPGGADAFERRLTDLRGYPVVVNKWASWCGPCRHEFPFFQQLSAKYGKRIAFLGVDSQDSDAAAKTFLAEAPLPYPSYTDPDEDIAAFLKATLGFPSTVFYAASGEPVYIKQGGYASQAELAADVRRYALSASSGGGSG